MAKRATFEQDFNALKELVDKIENKELDIEEALKLYEDGVKLYRKCQKRISSIEQKIQKIQFEDDSLVSFEE